MTAQLEESQSTEGSTTDDSNHHFQRTAVINYVSTIRPTICCLILYLLKGLTSRTVLKNNV